jgi:hypothetical protein
MGPGVKLVIHALPRSLGSLYICPGAIFFWPIGLDTPSLDNFYDHDTRTIEEAKEVIHNYPKISQSLLFTVTDGLLMVTDGYGSSVTFLNGVIISLGP